MEGHPNRITGSKVTTILLNLWILPIGGPSAVKGLRVQPVQQACFLHCQDFRLNSFTTPKLSRSSNSDKIHLIIPKIIKLPFNYTINSAKHLTNTAQNFLEILLKKIAELRENRLFTTKHY